MEQEIKLEMKRQGLTMEVDREEFAVALKTWRIRQGLRQRDVAKMFGVSRDTIMWCENARPVSWRMAYRIFARLAQELRKEGQA